MILFGKILPLKSHPKTDNLLIPSCVLAVPCPSQQLTFGFGWQKHLRAQCVRAQCSVFNKTVYPNHFKLVQPSNGLPHQTFLGLPSHVQTRSPAAQATERKALRTSKWEYNHHIVTFQAKRRLTNPNSKAIYILKISPWARSPFEGVERSQVRTACERRCNYEGWRKEAPWNAHSVTAGLASNKWGELAHTLTWNKHLTKRSVESLKPQSK